MCCKWNLNIEIYVVTIYIIYSLMGGLFILRIINDPFTMRFLNVYIHNNILSIDNHWFHLPPRHRLRADIFRNTARDFPFHNIMHRLQLQQMLKTIIICVYWSIEFGKIPLKKLSTWLSNWLPKLLYFS